MLWYWSGSVMRTSAFSFSLFSSPEAFLFDKNGKLVYHGAIDDSQKLDQVSKHFLQDAIDAATAGKDIPVKETKFVGCGIKYRTKT